MLSRMLDEAIEAVTEDMDQEELEAFLESVFENNPELVDLVEEGWILDEALDHLDQLTELKIPSPKDMETRRRAKTSAKSKANLRKGNPNNNPWSDYGAKGRPGAAGTGGNTMHNVLGNGGRSKTGEWQCKCQDYTCDCRNVKTGFTKTFTIKKNKHLAYNKRYKAHAHPNKDHPNSV